MGEYKQPAVLILYSHELLADGIRALLNKEGIRSLVKRADSAELAKSLRRIHPQVVIIEDAGQEFPQFLAGVLAQESQALVVRVSLSDSRMLYYRGQQTEASQADLTQLVLARVAANLREAAEDAAGVLQPSHISQPRRKKVPQDCGPGSH